MNRLVKWRDRSHQFSERPERWVPEAVIFVQHGSSVTEHILHLSDADIEKVKQGEWIFPTAEAAKVQAYAMAQKGAIEICGGKEVELQEI